MAETYSVQAVLSVKDKNFTSGMANASNALANVDSSTQKSSKSAGALGTAFAIANKVVSGACNVIKSSVSDAVARVDTLNNYPKIMEQMGFSSESAEKSIDKLSSGIQGLPTSLDSIVSSAQNIALITGNLDEATDVALALNDAMLASGASTDGAERATEAYDKMLSTGKVNSQNWTTLQQNMGYALQQVAKELGITSGSTQELYDKMQSGEITFDDFNQALIKCDTCTGGFAETASVACDGIATSWQNVKTAVVRGVANMIQAWNDAANDNGIPTIQNSLHTLQNVVDTCFTAASKVITVFVKNLDTIVSACVPVVAGIASLKIIQTISQHFKDFKKNAESSVKVLQDWDKNMERSQKASENLEKAQKNLSTAQEKYDTALGNVVKAEEKENEAKEKSEAATQKYNKMLEESKTTADKSKKTTEELAKAEEEATQATSEYEAAQEASAKASEEYEQAKQGVADADSKVTACEGEQASAMQNVSTKAILQSAMMNVLSGDMGVAKAAMDAFNAACEANPLGVVITAVTTVISVMKGLESALKKAGIMAEDASDRWKDLKENIDDLYDSLEESDKEFKNSSDTLKEEKANVENLWGEIQTLTDHESLSADQSERMNDLIYQLNETVPGLGLAFDDATGSLNQGADAVDAYIEAWEALDQLSVVTEEYNQALENQAATHLELKEAQEEYNNTLADMQDSSKILTNCSANNIITYFKEKKAVQDLEEEDANRTQIAKDLAEQRRVDTEKASQALAEAYNQEVDRLREAVEQDTISYDDLSEANQEMVDNIKGNYDDLVDAAHDMTTAIETEDEQSAQDYVDTLKKNNEALQGWGDNMDTLRQRFEELGLDDAVLDDFAAMGTDGIPMVADFVDASDDTLRELVDEWGETGSDAWDEGLKPALGAAADQIPSSVEEYITTPLEDSLSDGLAKADWAEPSADLMQNLWDAMASEYDNVNFDDLGISIEDGVAKGMETELPEVTGQGRTSMGLVYDAQATYIGMGSPAEKYVPMGESIDEGIAKGIRESESVVENAAKRILRDIEQTFNSLGSTTSSGLSSMLSAFKSGMSSMQSTASSGMTNIASAVTSGMNTIKSTMTSAMNSIKTSVTSGMNSIKSVMSSGFNSMASTVSSQMSKIKSSFQSGMAAIKSVVSSGMSSTNSAMTSAMNSMATGVTSGMNRMNSAMQSGMNNVRNTAQNIANSVVSAFNGLYNSLYNSGAHAMNGFINGMVSRQSGVMKTAQNIANSASNTINNALQIGSPSKLMKKTGQYVGEGLVLGLKAMISDVQSMSGKMADAVNSMVFGAFDSPELAFAGGMDIGMSYTLDGEDILDALEDLKDSMADNSFEFTIPLDVDGRQIAKATATYTQDELNKMESRDSRRQKFSIGG